MPNRELLFIMERQKYSNWCWAANAASISRYYNHASHWSQCIVVCTCLNRQDCCGNSIPKACDIPYYLEDALTVTDNFRDLITGQLPPGPLTNEINLGRIIGARIRWSSGDGHFVSIHGYNNLTNDIFLYIADPIYGKVTLRVNDFATNYQSAGGFWTHTYLTKADNAMLEFTKINDDLLLRAKELSQPNIFEKKENFKLITESFEQSKSESMPHDVYIISYNSLKNRGPVELTKGGVRLLDKKEDGKTLIFEFSNTGSEANLQQVFSGDDYTENYKNTLNLVKESFEKTKDVFEIATVRLPDLKVDALWLHSIKSPEIEDTFIPLFTNDFLNANQSYGGQAFFNLLREKVKEKKVNTDDRLGG